MKEFILHYCDKCGDLTDEFSVKDSSLICQICGGNLKPVPREYTDFTGMIIEPNKKQEFIEKVLKLSPNFDQTAWDKRVAYEEVRIRQYEMLKQEQTDKPKCPICGSTNIKKITLTKKVVKTAAFGILGAMDDAGKTWKCSNCGSKF